MKMWRRLPLGRSRCPRGPPLCLVCVYSRGLPFQRKGYPSSSLLLWLPGSWCMSPQGSCLLCSSILTSSWIVWPVRLFPLATSPCVYCFSLPPLPPGLVSESSRVCLRRCHCAPSRLRGPEVSWIVSTPCVVTALVRPLVVSQNSRFSKIQTTPISGGFLMRSKMSSCTRFLSSNISGCLDVWGTENLSLPGFCCFQPSCLSTGPGVLHPPCV